MERFLVIDYKNKTIWATSDIRKIDSGGSVACIDNKDLFQELEKQLASDRHYVEQYFK